MGSEKAREVLAARGIIISEEGAHPEYNLACWEIQDAILSLLTKEPKA